MSISTVLTRSAHTVADKMDKIMADIGGVGKNSESVSAAFTRWIISLMVAILMGMSGVVWANLTSQINDLRADIRITQKDNSDLRLSVQDLKTRITLLVDTLNSREEIPPRVKR